MTHLSLQDISVDSWEYHDPRIKQSKIDPFWQGCTLCLENRQEHLSHYHHLTILGKRGGEAHYGPLFIMVDGTYLTCHILVTLLSDSLQEAGIDSTGYNSYSFRISAATIAKEKGISDVHIKMLSRWKSNAYQLHVHTPQEQLAKLSNQLVSSNEH